MSRPRAWHYISNGMVLAFAKQYPSAAAYSEERQWLETAADNGHKQNSDISE